MTTTLRRFKFSADPEKLAEEVRQFAEDVRAWQEEIMARLSYTVTDPDPPSERE